MTHGCILEDYGPPHPFPRRRTCVALYKACCLFRGRGEVGEGWHVKYGGAGVVRFSWTRFFFTFCYINSRFVHRHATLRPALSKTTSSLQSPSTQHTKLCSNSTATDYICTDTHSNTTKTNCILMGVISVTHDTQSTHRRGSSGRGTGGGLAGPSARVGHMMLSGSSYHFAIIVVVGPTSSTQHVCAC